jgi:hypothetical protein
VATIFLDGTTPPAVRSTSGSGTATVTTSSFSPPAGGLLVAVLIAQYVTKIAPPTMTMVDSASGVWVSQAHAFTGTTAFAQSQIWTQQLAGAPGAITVTGSRGGATNADVSMYVAVMMNAASDQSAAGITQNYQDTASVDAATSQGATVATLNSWMFVGVSYADIATTTWAPSANTTSIDVWSDGSNVSSNLIGRATNPTAATGTLDLGWTGGAHSAARNVAYTALEIVQDAPTPYVPPTDIPANILVDPASVGHPIVAVTSASSGG